MWRLPGGWGGLHRGAGAEAEKMKVALGDPAGCSWLVFLKRRSGASGTYRPQRSCPVWEALLILMVLGVSAAPFWIRL